MERMNQKRAYKYRFSPTDEQAHMLACTFGCCRYVYNWALRQRTDAFFQHGERLSYAGTAERLTTLKKQEDHAWLNEVASVPLQQSLRHLDTAFRNFFEGRAEYPTSHKKHGQQAATYVGTAFKWDGQHLTLARMDTPLAIHWSRSLPKGCQPASVTISKDRANRYFLWRGCQTRSGENPSWQVSAKQESPLVRVGVPWVYPWGGCQLTHLATQGYHRGLPWV